jgi:uncharacterized membrane protein YeaQ/YmgE (transglycosylase-associated protein family)
LQPDSGRKRRRTSLQFYNLAVGPVGAIVGGLIFGALRIVPEPGFLGNLISATIGAIVFLLIWRAIKRA